MKINPCLAIFSALILMISAPGAAQEALSLDEILRWIPLADFKEVVHYDKAAAERTQAYADFVECGFPDNNAYYLDESRLPPSLRGSFESVTYVLLAETDAERKPDTYDRLNTELDEDTKLYIELQRAYRKKDEVWIWRFPELDSLIKKAMEAGELAETGERSFGRPVYACSGDVRGVRKNGSEEALFAYATESQELLAAGELESIKRMAAAGHGLELSLLDDEVIGQFAGIYRDAGQFWHLTNHYSIMKAGLMVLNAEGYPKEKIDEFVERMENGELFYLHTYLLDEQITEKAIHFYGSDEFEKYRFFRNQVSSPYPETDELLVAHRQLMDRKEKREVVGNTEIITRVYDEELLESLRKVNKYWEMRRKGFIQPKGVRQ